MVKEKWHLKMGQSILDNGSLTKLMDKDKCSFQMESWFMMVIGLMANSTEKAHYIMISSLISHKAMNKFPLIIMIYLLVMHIGSVLKVIF